MSDGPDYDGSATPVWWLRQWLYWWLRLEAIAQNARSPIGEGIDGGLTVGVDASN